MKVKCVMCGKEEEITKLHKDYKKLAAKQSTTYFCQACSAKLTGQAAREKKTGNK